MMYMYIPDSVCWVGRRNITCNTDSLSSTATFKFLCPKLQSTTRKYDFLKYNTTNMPILFSQILWEEVGLTGVHKSCATGHQSNLNLVWWVLSMELLACHPSGAKNFELDHGFWKTCGLLASNNHYIPYTSRIRTSVSATFVHRHYCSSVTASCALTETTLIHVSYSDVTTEPLVMQHRGFMLLAYYHPVSRSVSMF